MTRKRSTLTQLRRALYLSQRGIGDVQAVEKGRVVPRIERRIVGRMFGRLLGKLFR